MGKGMYLYWRKQRSPKNLYTRMSTSFFQTHFYKKKCLFLKKEVQRFLLFCYVLFDTIETYTCSFILFRVGRSLLALLSDFCLEKICNDVLK